MNAAAEAIVVPRPGSPTRVDRLVAAIPPTFRRCPVGEVTPAARSGLLRTALKWNLSEVLGRAVLDPNRFATASSPTSVVLFICVENAARSLMAEAMFNARPPDGWHAISAGTRPAPAPNPRTGPMLQELGLALPAHPPQLLTPEVMDAASYRITMGCLDDASCPARLKTLELRDWGLRDPAKLDDAGFRAVRDELLDRVEGLRREIGKGSHRPVG